MLCSNDVFFEPLTVVMPSVFCCFRALSLSVTMNVKTTLCILSQTPVVLHMFFAPGDITNMQYKVAEQVSFGLRLVK